MLSKTVWLPTNSCPWLPGAPFGEREFSFATSIALRRCLYVCSPVFAFSARNHDLSYGAPTLEGSLGKSKQLPFLDVSTWSAASLDVHPECVHSDLSRGRGQAVQLRANAFQAANGGLCLYIWVQDKWWSPPALNKNTPNIRSLAIFYVSLSFIF